jgi:hypothetical protein
MLNTVANTNRQTTQVLPPSHHSTDIPDVIERRSRDTRQIHGGLANPLYDLTAPAAPLLTRTTVTASAPSTLPRCPAVNPSPSNSSRSALPSQPSQSSSEGTQTQTDTEELASGQSAQTGSAPGLSSETGENDENNNNDDDFSDLNISSPPSQSTTGSAHCQDQTRHPGDLLSDQINRHISHFDPNGIYPLPGESQQTGDFSQDYLQQHGLLNDGNICSLISLILGLHRLGIK